MALHIFHHVEVRVHFDESGVPALARAITQGARLVADQVAELTEKVAELSAGVTDIRSEVATLTQTLDTEITQVVAALEAVKQMQDLTAIQSAVQDSIDTLAGTKTTLAETTSKIAGIIP